MQRSRLYLVISIVIFSVAGCSVNKDTIINSDLPIHMQFGRDSNGKVVKSYKIGIPYQINDIWYYPAEDFGYKERGIASWYGPGFQGKNTANGEVYNMNDMTAAHKTLPMSSIVTVRNLINGKIIKVRINDRGPFIEGRIIDLSRRAARALNIEISGTAPVEVVIVPEDSLTIKNIAFDSKLPNRQNIFKAPTPNTSDIISSSDLLPIVEKGRRIGGTVSPIIGTNIPVSPAIEFVPLVEQSINIVRALPLSKDAGPLIQRERAVSSVIPNAVVPNITKDSVNETINSQLSLFDPGDTRFYVQAGAFTDIQNAESLSKSIASFGRSEISLVTRADQRFYRVRLGPLDTRKDAEKRLLELRNSGIKSAEVVED